LLTLVLLPPFSPPCDTCHRQFTQCVHCANFCHHFHHTVPSSPPGSDNPDSTLTHGFTTALSCTNSIFLLMSTLIQSARPVLSWASVPPLLPAWASAVIGARTCPHTSCISRLHAFALVRATMLFNLVFTDRNNTSSTTSATWVRRLAQRCRRACVRTQINVHASLGS
jgi:hypothetical protein